MGSTQSRPEASSAVASTNSRLSSSQYDDYTFAERLQLRDRCGRFRILVIGRSNAGKTTICQRMCRTTNPPVVRDKDGNPINVTPDMGRGFHNIEDEITYETNSGFVFHDSGGFESGSDEELKIVREFIRTRSETSQLKDRLHAIWFCLPVDDDRPFIEAEMKFFEEGTHPVPVIGIFTKCDAQFVNAQIQLEEAGVDDMDNTEQAQAVEVKKYLHGLESAWRETRHPPAAYCSLQDMDNADDDSQKRCEDLVEKTADSIDDKVLKLLFVSVQRSNTKVCIKLAVEGFIKENFRVHTSVQRYIKMDTNTLLTISDRFPHLRYRPYFYDYGSDCRYDGGYHYDYRCYGVSINKNDPLIIAFQPQMVSFSSPFVQVAGFLITAEASFWMCQQDPGSSWKEAAISAYMSSSAEQAVTKAIQSANLKDMAVKEMQQWFTELVLDNLLPRPGVDLN